MKNNRKLEVYKRWCPHCKEYKETTSQTLVKCNDCQQADAIKKLEENRRNKGRNSMEKKYTKTNINVMRAKLGWAPL